MLQDYPGCCLCSMVGFTSVPRPALGAWSRGVVLQNRGSGLHTPPPPHVPTSMSQLCASCSNSTWPHHIGSLKASMMGVWTPWK
jgi:hypothetical protein